jgi:outer membrane lipoprotein LolB
MKSPLQRLISSVPWLKGKTLAALLAGINLLAACAITSSTVPLNDTPWLSRQASLKALRYWDVSGRIAVINDQQGWHASLRWIQRGSAYAIELFGPLGQGRLNIHGSPQGVSMQTADGQVLSAADPEQLLEQTTGMRIPISGLVYWLRGLPDPSQSSELTGNEKGQLTRLNQGDWVIEYPLYTEVAKLELPTRIQAYRDQLKVKVVIDTWKLQP